MVEGVAMFKYLGIILYQIDDDWMVVRQNILRARSIRGKFGKLLLQKGADPRLSEMFTLQWQKR